MEALSAYENSHVNRLVFNVKFSFIAYVSGILCPSLGVIRNNGDITVKDDWKRAIQKIASI